MNVIGKVVATGIAAAVLGVTGCSKYPDKGTVGDAAVDSDFSKVYFYSEEYGTAERQKTLDAIDQVQNMAKAQDEGLTMAKVDEAYTHMPKTQKAEVLYKAIEAYIAERDGVVNKWKTVELPAQIKEAEAKVSQIQSKIDSIKEKQAAYENIVGEAKRAYDENKQKIEQTRKQVTINENAAKEKLNQVIMAKELAVPVYKKNSWSTPFYRLNKKRLFDGQCSKRTQKGFHFHTVKNGVCYALDRRFSDELANHVGDVELRKMFMAMVDNDVNYSKLRAEQEKLKLTYNNKKVIADNKYPNYSMFKYDLDSLSYDLKNSSLLIPDSDTPVPFSKLSKLESAKELRKAVKSNILKDFMETSWAEAKEQSLIGVSNIQEDGTFKMLEGAEFAKVIIAHKVVKRKKLYEPPSVKWNLKINSLDLTKESEGEIYDVASNSEKTENMNIPEKILLSFGISVERLLPMMSM